MRPEFSWPGTGLPFRGLGLAYVRGLGAYHAPVGYSPFSRRITPILRGVSQFLDGGDYLGGGNEPIPGIPTDPSLGGSDVLPGLTPSGDGSLFGDSSGSLPGLTPSGEGSLFGDSSSVGGTLPGLTPSGEGSLITGGSDSSGSSGGAGSSFLSNLFGSLTTAAVGLGTGLAEQAIAAGTTAARQEAGSVLDSVFGTTPTTTGTTSKPATGTGASAIGGAGLAIAALAALFLLGGKKR